MVCRHGATVLLAGLVLLATLGPVGAGSAASQAQSPRQQGDAGAAPPDPRTDTIGWENGYWYNESINVSQIGESAGLTAAEQRRLLARGMARVEHLRGLEFTANLSLEFISRDRFSRGLQNGSLPARFSSPQLYETFTLSEQFWEATFVYGEDTNATARVLEFGAKGIIGYSAEEGFENRLIVVTRSAATPRLSSTVLSHELTHALQGQHFDLDAARYDRKTHDGRHGKDGILEGGAAYVDYLYQRKCGGEWECIATPRNWAGLGQFDGLAYSYAATWVYSDGGGLVHDLVERGGWDAVAARHHDLPTSSEQVIHSALDEPVRSLDAPDRSTAAWHLQEAERVGEATMFMMFWQQGIARDPDTVEAAVISEGAKPYDRLNFTSDPSVGWGADRLLLYRNGDRQAYVWYTAWDSPRDAREFASAYRTLLSSYGGQRRGPNTTVIPANESFGDAFRVVRNGTRVRIVNAPTVAALSDLAGGGGTAASTPTATTTRSPTTGTAGSTPPPDVEPTVTPTTVSPTTDAQGGLSLLVPLLALALLVLLAARRDRPRR